MKLIIPLLLFLTACHAKADKNSLKENPSHYVIHAKQAEYIDGILTLNQLDKNLTYYMSDQHKGVGQIEMSQFIDKVYQNKPVTFAFNGKMLQVNIKNLRYNPYNERLLLELETSPFEQGKTFEHVTLIFH